MQIMVETKDKKYKIKTSIDIKIRNFREPNSLKEKAT